MSEDDRRFDHAHFRNHLKSRLRDPEVRERIYRQLALSRRTVNAWLTDRADTSKTSMPGLDKAVPVAVALGVSLDYLATGREFWPEMNDERLKRLVLRLRWLDERTLSALEAAIDTLIAKSEPESAGSASGEEEDQAQSPSQG